jgi:hypothetical protein
MEDTVDHGHEDGIQDHHRNLNKGYLVALHSFLFFVENKKLHDYII